MFTGQLIGYVGADARSNKSGKGFYFPVSSKFKVSSINSIYPLVSDSRTL